MGKIIRLQNNKSYLLSSMKDLEDLVEPEIFEAITYFTENKENEEDESLQSQISGLEDELESYESTVESQENCMREIKANTEQLIEDIKNAKRMDKQEILKTLNYFVKTINEEL